MEIAGIIFYVVCIILFTWRGVVVWANKVIDSWLLRLFVSIVGFPLLGYMFLLFGKVVVFIAILMTTPFEHLVK